MYYFYYYLGLLEKLQWYRFLIQIRVLDCVYREEVVS